MTGVAWRLPWRPDVWQVRLMVSDDVASKRRSSLGMEILLAAALPNLTWRDRNITWSCDECLRVDAYSV